jgi:hypothetical protein
MQMQQTAEATVQKQEADAKAAADKAQAAEAKRFSALPFSKRVEEVAQKHLEDLRNSSTYMPPATGVAAAPIRPFNPATSAVEERGARLLAMREELAPLGLRPSEIEDRTWTDKARALAAQHAPGTREPWRPSLVRGTIKREFKKNVIAKGVKDEWGPGDEEAFYSRIFTDAGIADLPAPPRAAGTARTPMAARAMGADKQLTNAMRRLGITPAPVDQERAARGLEYPNEEGGEPLDPYEFLRRNVATAQSKRGELSSRALSTMGVQYVGRKFGPWGRIHQREVELTAATTKAKGEVGEYKTLRGEYEAQAPIVMGLRTSARAPGATAEDKASFVELRRRFLDLGKATHAQAKVANDAVMAQAELSAKITTTGDTIQHFGASFAGGVVGGFVGAMAGMISQPLIQAVGMAVEKVGGPMVDQALGFTMTRQRTMGELAQQTEAAGGIASVAFAQKYQFAPASVTGPMAGAVTAQAETIAANKQMESVRDLYRTQKGLPTGPNGAPAALYSTQGPLGNPLLADYKSTAELFGSEFQQVFDKQSNGRLFFAGNMDENQRWANTVNQMLGGTKSRYEFRQGSEQERTAANQSMTSMGLANVLAGGFVAIDKATGKVATSAEGLAAVLVEAAKNFSRIDPEQYIAQNRPQWRAQMEGAQLQTQLQVQTVNPIQRYMDYITNRPLPFGTGVMPDLTGAAAKSTPALGYDAQKGLTSFPGVTPATLQSFSNLEAAANKSRAAIKTMAAEGRAELERLNVPTQTIDRIASIGEEIAAAQTKIGGIQANLNWTRYNHDLVIARRGVTDMLQLTGKLGQASGDNVGYYERQLLLINRASTALSLQLQQRQITTQQAIAGFAVQGDTPEIRMARRKEAMLAADIANKQLDYSKQAFGTEIKLVDAQNLRQLQDAMYSLADLVRGFNASNEIALIQDFINTKQREMQLLVPDAAAWISLKTGYESMMITIAQDLAAKTDAAVADVLGQKIKPAILDLLSMLPAWLGGGIPNTLGIPGAGAASTGPTNTTRGTSAQNLLIPPAGSSSGPRNGTPTTTVPVTNPNNRDTNWQGYSPVPAPVPRSRNTDRADPDQSPRGRRVAVDAGDYPSNVRSSAGRTASYVPNVTTNNTTNNNQKVEIKPVFNLSLPTLDQAQVADLSATVVKNINTALALVGLRPVAR